MTPSALTLSLLLAGAASALSFPAFAGGPERGSERDDRRGEHRHERGHQSVQLGPRPQWLVDDMDDSHLKRHLQRCDVNKPRSSRFSIGHRGAPLQFPEHTRESYIAAARMGAGILECDVAFTKDRELVCRHAQNDLHTTTNIVTIPELNAKCTQPFVPADPATGTQAQAECRTSDITLAEFKQLIALADEHDFIIASDECYSELYLDENTPPPGLLQACAELGRDDYRRCVVFHSLSKRSNLPGLRSGFVAGDADLLAPFKRYRTYHGCAMSLPLQHASIAAWQDEVHVRANRDAYREKFSAVTDVLAPVMDFPTPEASFYLWPAVPGGDDIAFTQRLFSEQHVSVLPGSLMGRPGQNGLNPGAGRLRLALVAELEPTLEAAKRLRQLIERD